MYICVLIYQISVTFGSGWLKSLVKAAVFHSLPVQITSTNIWMTWRRPQIWYFGSCTCKSKRASYSVAYLRHDAVYVCFLNFLSVQINIMLHWSLWANGRFLCIWMLSFFLILRIICTLDCWDSDFWCCSTFINADIWMQ